MDSITEEQIVELFNNVTFFDGLNLMEKQYLASGDCSVLRFNDGDSIIRQGDWEDCSLYILLKGGVRVTKSKIPEGDDKAPISEILLNRLDPGSVFGEIALVSHRSRTTSVYAEGLAIVLRLEVGLLEALDPVVSGKIKSKLLELVISRLDSMNEHLLKLVR